MEIHYIFVVFFSTAQHTAFPNVPNYGSFADQLVDSLGDRIANWDAIRVIDRGNGDEGLELITDIHFAGDVHGWKSRLILIGNFSLHTENQLCARQKWFHVIIPVEPLFRVKNRNRRCLIELHNIVTAWNEAYIMLVSCIDYALDMTCIQSVSQCFIVGGIL